MGEFSHPVKYLEGISQKEKGAIVVNSVNKQSTLRMEEWNVTLPNRSSGKSPRCQGFLLTSRLFSPVSLLSPLFLYHHHLMIQFNGISLTLRVNILFFLFLDILAVDDGRCNGNNKKPMAPHRAKVAPAVSPSQSGNLNLFHYQLLSNLHLFLF